MAWQNQSTKRKTYLSATSSTTNTIRTSEELNLEDHGQKLATNLSCCRAIAQAVSRRLPTAAARVETQVWSCGDFVMDKSGAGAGFLREFPLQIHNSICFSTIIFTITRGWHNRPGVAAVPIASQTPQKT
jgi:hypothetical protein